MADNYVEKFGSPTDPYIVGISLTPTGTLYSPQETFRNSLSISELGGKKKNTSFQITSVTVQGSRLNEPGEESCDDLDESNAEDFNSELIETSKATECDADILLDDSQDLYSHSLNRTIGRTDSEKSNRSISMGPQLNIAVAPTIANKGVNVSAGVTMVTTTTTVTSREPMGSEQWQHRFKVVKIVSSEPFHRGRWLCMDFIDPPAVNSDIKTENGETHVNIEDSTKLNPELTEQTVTHVYEIPVNNVAPGSPPSVPPVYGIILPVNGNQSPPTQNVGIQTNQLCAADKSELTQGIQTISAPSTLLHSITEPTPLSAPIDIPTEPNLELQQQDVVMDTYPKETIPTGTTSSVNSSLHEMIPDALGTRSLSVPDDGTENTNSNTVAIDNKIEQAMDLVKSHLMFAVREEVEVLKVKISDLSDRISHLERENKFLRAHASPETLAKLGHHPAPSSSTPL